MNCARHDWAIHVNSGKMHFIREPWEIALVLDDNGNVGIGTTNPEGGLHIANSGQQWGEYNYGTNIIVKGGGRHPAIGIFDHADANPWAIVNGGGNLSFNQMPPTGDITSPPTNRVIIDKLGKVGIGTTEPGNLLEIQNNGVTTPGIIINNSNGKYQLGVGINYANDGKFGIYDYKGGSNRFVLDENGNVGIGTTNPSAKLEVHGDIKLTGDVLLLGADCAEDFNIAGVEEIEAGTVMIISQNGALRPSQKSYDKRVAGVISGAGDFRSGIVLDKQAHDAEIQRRPLALVGKVFCKVDASYSPIEVGDLLTSSPTPGHGMKADDPAKAFGTVFGKALRGLENGQGLIPILVCLQ